MKRLKRKDYEAALAPMQVALAEMAHWVQVCGKRVLIVFEGRDTAGKGGTIQAISEHLNPRQCRVTALPKPSDREQGQWYFQRYVEHLPAAGQIEALARTFGVPVGALLATLASTFDPARTKGEHTLLAAYRALDTRQQGALLEVARGMAGMRAERARRRNSPAQDAS